MPPPPSELVRKFTYFGSLIRPLAADETSIEDGLQCIALQCSSKTSFDIKTRSSVVNQLSHQSCRCIVIVLLVLGCWLMSQLWQKLWPDLKSYVDQWVPSLKSEQVESRPRHLHSSHSNFKLIPLLQTQVPIWPGKQTKITSILFSSRSKQFLTGFSQIDFQIFSNWQPTFLILTRPSQYHQTCSSCCGQALTWRNLFHIIRAGVKTPVTKKVCYAW